MAIVKYFLKMAAHSAAIVIILVLLAPIPLLATAQGVVRIGLNSPSGHQMPLWKNGYPEHPNATTVHAPILHRLLGSRWRFNGQTLGEPPEGERSRTVVHTAGDTR